MARLIESSELWFIGIVALLGFVFSTRYWISFLNDQNPFVGVLLWYALTGIILALVFSIFDVRVGITILRANPIQIFGSLLVLFSFFIVTAWGTSCLTNEYLHNNCDISNIYQMQEDGAVWYLWKIAGIQDIFTLRMLTYVLTPSLTAFFGSLLITSKGIAKALQF